MQFSEDKIRTALLQSWSLETAIQWQPDKPALGQCNVTALLIEEIFGGKILKTGFENIFHFYNEIDGRRYDFTDSQFDSPIEYEDLQSSPDEAWQGIPANEMATLRKAFQTFYT